MTNENRRVHAMNESHDEIRRELRETQQLHASAQPRLATALDQAFDPDGGVPAAEKHQLLGLPNRRGFLRIGGLSVALSAFAVACVEQHKEDVQLAQTGTLPATSSTVKPPNPGS